MTTSELIAKVEAGEFRRMKQGEKIQKAIDSAARTIYESQKASADQHPVKCTCWLHDAVADYEYLNGINAPAEEPSYCF